MSVERAQKWRYVNGCNLSVGVLVACTVTSLLNIISSSNVVDRRMSMASVPVVGQNKTVPLPSTMKSELHLHFNRRNVVEYDNNATSGDRVSLVPNGPVVDVFHELSPGERQLNDPCRRKANTYVRQHADGWFDDGVPVLSFVSEAPPHGPEFKTTNQSNLYFILVTKGNSNNIMGRYAKKASFTCGNHLGKVLGVGCKMKRSLIIVCPRDYTISQLMAAPKHPKGRSVKSVVYNVSNHLACLQREQQRLRNNKATTINSSLAPALETYKAVVSDTKDEDNVAPITNVRVAQCLIVHGWKARRQLKRNIVYHRLMGIDHAFVYVHDNSSNVVDLPLYEEEYVTYIPSDFMSPYLYNHTRGDVGYHYQQAQLLECLTRSRAAGFDFVLLADVDELVQIMDYPKTTLKHILQDHVFNTSGLILYSVNFPPLNSSFWEQADWFDFRWRQSSTPEHVNVKTIVNVGTTYYHSVHRITGSMSSEGAVVHTDQSQIRLVHVRNPDNKSAVYSSSKYDLEEDLSLQVFQEQVPEMVRSFL